MLFNRVETRIHFPWLSVYYIDFLYKNNVDFKKAVTAIKNDVVNSIVDDNIDKKVMKQILEQYILYGAVCISKDMSTVYDLRYIVSVDTEKKKASFLNGITLNLEEVIWFNIDPSYSFDYMDYYSIHECISMNISINKLFSRRIDQNGIKEGFLTMIGEVDKESASEIESKIDTKMKNPDSNFVVLPFVAAPISSTGNGMNLNVDFIEVPTTTEDFISNTYVFNKGEIAQGFGLLPERIFNLQSSQRSGSYQSTANERLTLLLNIYKSNVNIYQNILQEILGTPINFRMTDFQSSADKKMEYIKGLYVDGVISRNELIEIVNEELNTGFEIGGVDYYNIGMNEIKGGKND